MVDTSVLGAGAARRMGSSPFLSTSVASDLGRLRIFRQELPPGLGRLFLFFYFSATLPAAIADYIISDFFRVWHKSVNNFVR